MVETRGLTTLLVASMLLGACAGSHPSVTVLGVGAQERADRQLIVLVEVVNPSQTEMVLSKFKYELKCAPWIDSSGTVSLSRSLPANSSAVLQIPITVEDAPAPEKPNTVKNAAGSTKPIAVEKLARLKKRLAGLGYELKGRLFAIDRQLERSWEVSAKGRFGLNASTSHAPTIRLAGSSVRGK